MLGRAVYVIDHVRTPFARIGGAYSAIRPDDLAALVVRGAVERLADLLDGDADRAGHLVDEVTLGAANQAGEDNRNVARMAALLAGLPMTVTGSTVNRLCASGLEAVVGAARAIAVGEADVVVAGGVESMTRAPWVVPKPDKAFPTAHQQMWSTTLGWRMTNPHMSPEWTLSLVEATERLATEYGIARHDADAFAARSHERAAAAWAAGAFNIDTLGVADSPLRRDESIRDAVTVDALSVLRPVFGPDGQVTAGNASPLNDGAAAVVLADGASVERHGLVPLARVVSSATQGVEPQRFGIGPVEAVREAVRRSAGRLEDLQVLELNEAFAAQSLACLSGWPELDPEVFNPHGGAIAIGHPLGASGARLAGTVARQLSGKPGSQGVATLCIGVGQGQALVLEGV